MGLLDQLFPSSDGGGLLDFLKRNAELQPMNSGLPSDQAQYGSPQMPGAGPGMAQAAPQQIAQPSPLDTAQWPYGPNGAPSQANAQMPGNPSPIAAQPAAAPIAAPPAAPAVASGSPGFMTGYENLHHGGGLIGSIVAGITGQRNDPQGVAQQQQAQVANVTARALIGKGVDPQIAIAAVQPGNTELLKTLVTQTFGPQTIENLGSGYIRDPRSGKVTRAYTPDDKTPTGFAQGDDGTMHFVPGGPADPAYLRTKAQQGIDPNAVHVLGKGGELYKAGPDGTPVIVHKNESEAPEATLDDATVKAMASQYLAGGKDVMTNLGRGAQGAANIVKLRTEIYKQAGDQGLDGKAIVNNFNEQAGALAGQRSIGTRAANISLAANEANNMIPIALDASAKVPRGEWMPWNKMVQAYQTGTSSPELARFVAATNSLVNSYVRAVSPSGVPTDSMREHAYSMLNSAQSPQAYQAVTSIMQDEMKAAMAAPGQVRKELRHEDDGKSSPKEAPKPGNYVWSLDKGLTQQ